MIKRKAFSALLALALCLTLLPVPAGAADGAPPRKPDRVIPVGESASFSCGLGNGSSYTWSMDPDGYDIFKIGPSGSRCTLTAKRPGWTQLWVQYSVTLYGPGLDRFGNYITVRYPDGYEKIGWLVQAAGEPCTVTFHRLDGSAPFTRDAFIGGTASAPAGVSRPGFALDGWFTDAACTRRYDFSTPLTGDLALYAGWLRAWTVTYVSAGGRTEERVADGRTASASAPDNLRGYAFEGWYTDAARARPYDLTAPVTGNLTLYAKQRLLEEAAVSYDCRDGSRAARVTYYVGETPAPPAGPALDGYVFQGWYTDPGLARPWTPGPLTGDLALYAGWRRMLAVSFDSRGGSAVQPQAVLEGDPAERPEDPEREGHTFDGWYRDSACADAWDFSRDRTDGEATLYAGWDPVPHTVRFSGAGSQTVYHGQRAEEPAAPSRPGARFSGWYTDENARTLYLFRSPVAEDLTLYPGWLEERKEPADPAPGPVDPADPVDPENSLEVLEWLENSVVLTGPAEKLEALGQVWAASYDRAGRLALAVPGRLEPIDPLGTGRPGGVEAVFPARPAKGWRLFFLDAAGRPPARPVILE